MSERPNIPLPDELADIRAQIKQLQSRESELRRILLADPSARTGKDWAAEVISVTTMRTDVKEMRAMHRALTDEYTFPFTAERIDLKQINEDGELVKPKRNKDTE